MSNIKPEEERFYDNLEILINCIEYNFKNISAKTGINISAVNMIPAVKTFLPTFSKNYIIEMFIDKSHQKCWNIINERNEEYFLNNASTLLSFIPSNNVNVFKDLFLAKNEDGEFILTDKDKETIYNLLDILIKISIKYVYRMRKTNPNFMPNVALEHHIQKWKVRVA